MDTEKRLPKKGALNRVFNKNAFQTYILVVFYIMTLEEMLDVSRQLVAQDSHKKQSRIQNVTNDNY